LEEARGRKRRTPSRTQRCATEGIGVNTYTILRLEKTSMGILNTSTTKSDCLHTTNFKDPY
jgi:hypothetical protein